MIDLSRHIEYLLLTRNVVCVQQLGTFRTQDCPSRWVEDEQIFLPPYRTILFDAHTDSEDNSFVQTLANRYRISQTEAQILHAEFVAYIEQELEESGSVDLGSIGVFVREQNGSETLFVPCEAGITTPSLYGLDAIHFAQLPVVEQVRIAAKQQEEKKITSVRSDKDYFIIRIHKKAVHYTTAAAAAIAFFFAIGNPVVTTDLKNPQIADTNLFLPSHLLAKPAMSTVVPAEKPEPSASAQATNVEKPVAATEPAPSAKPAEEKPAEKPKATEPAAKTADPTSTSVANKAAVPAKAETPAKTEAKATKPQGGYAVVLASAIPMEKAEEYAKKLNAKGVKAEARQFDKLVRVIIPGFQSAEGAHDKIKELKAQGDEFKQAWTLKLE